MQLRGLQAWVDFHRSHRANEPKLSFFIVDIAKVKEKKLKILIEGQRADFMAGLRLFWYFTQTTKGAAAEM